MLLKGDSDKAFLQTFVQNFTSPKSLDLDVRHRVRVTLVQSSQKMYLLFENSCENL